MNKSTFHSGICRAVLVVAPQITSLVDVFNRKFLSLCSTDGSDDFLIIVEEETLLPSCVVLFESRSNALLFSLQYTSAGVTISSGVLEVTISLENSHSGSLVHGSHADAALYCAYCLVDMGSINSRHQRVSRIIVLFG